jgi:tetratricopeptide (TPR) repeat protein
VAILVIVAMLATGVGIGLASALGGRSSRDTATGDIRQSSRGMLFEAQEHAVAGRWAEAEELYAAVVSAEPSSAEALAWWGWLDFQRGDLDSAADRLEAAVVADPLYPDARVFGAIVAFRLDRLDDAAAHLEAFDAVDPPPLMVELVENAELRQRILAGRIVAADAAGDTTAIESMLAVVSAGEMATAARHLADGGQVVLAARLFGTAVEADPTNVNALVGRGALLTSPDFASFEDLLTEGLRALDRAVQLEPDNPEARFWRALAAARLGLFAESLVDLDHLATLDAPPALLAEAARLAEEVRAAANPQLGSGPGLRGVLA